MPARNMDLERVASEVKKHLLDYLEEQGVEVSERKPIRCISKYHDDHDPSMFLLPFDVEDPQLKCFGCLPLYQEVVTSRGILPASDVRVGDLVFDVYGEKTSVTKIHQHKSELPTLRMKTSIDTDGFYATADHDMLWIPEPVSKRRDKRGDYRKANKIYEAELRHLKPGMWIPLSLPEGTSNREYYWLRNTEKTPKEKRSLVKIELDEVFAYFLGLYAAEGSISSNRIVQFSVHRNEVGGFFPVIDEIAKRIGSCAGIHNRTNGKGAEIYICDSRLVNLLDEIVGRGCRSKRCPNDVLFHVDSEIPRAWAKGLFDGDGYASRGILKLTSYNLARSFFTATLRSGCLPRWCGKTEIPGKKSVYTVNLLHNTVEQLFGVGIQERVHHDAALVWVDAWDGWTLCARIEEITSTGKCEVVVDVTTGLHTFSCPTVSVHNCGELMDTMTAAHHLEGKPLEGPEFVHENLFYLARKFDIPYDDIEFTPEEIELFKIRKFMRDVAQVFNEFIRDDEAHPHAEARGWTPDFCRELEVGTIRDVNAFYEAIKKAGMWTDTDLVVMGLKADRKKKVPRLFGPSMLSFLVRDHTGQPVGFASRNTKFKPGGKAPKYCNSPAWDEDLGAGCKIYHKGSVLYGLHLAKDQTHQRLDIFEGYPDLGSARFIGLKAVCAIGAVAFTNDHLHILKEMGFTHLNFIMDDDETGRRVMTGDPEKPGDRGYLGVAAGHEGIKVTVSKLPFGDEVPKDERDPDAYFRNHTAKDYHDNLVIYDAFDWELERIADGNMEPLQIIEKMIDFLGSEVDFINRRVKAKKLADVTDFPVEDIIAEFERRFNKEADEMIAEAVYKAGKAKNTADRINILQETLVKVAIPDEEKTDLTQVEVVNDYQAFVDKTEDEDTGLIGWDCGYQQLNEATDGIPKQGKWMAIAGGANVGKSALVLNILYRIAMNRANENVTVAYMSLDDDRHTAYAKLIAQDIGYSINDCAKPYRRIYNSDELTKRYKDSREKIFEMIKEGRLACKGEESGNTPEIAERWVRQIQDKTGNFVVLAVDSFNNMEIPGVAPDNDRVRLARLSGWFRRTTQSNPFSAIVTMEERKLHQKQEKATIQDLFGSGKMSYDLKFVGMLHNDLHARRDGATFYWRDDHGNKMPYIQMDVSKNKLSGFKGEIVYKFTPEHTRLDEIPHAIATNLKAQADNPNPAEEFEVEDPRKKKREKAEKETPAIKFEGAEIDF